MTLKIKPGNTPLIKNKELCEKFGFTNLFIKDESKNPFGTYKDRRSEFIFQKAKDEQVDKIVLITSGNAGYSLARFFQNSNTKIICIIDKKLKNSLKEKLKRYSKTIEIDLSERKLESKEIIELVRENKREIIWDVTNEFHEIYSEVIREIEESKPDIIIVPVGSGESFCGLYYGILKYNLKTKLIGVGVINKINSYASKLSTLWGPYESRIQSILKEGNELIRLSEEEIEKAYEENKSILDIEPSSAVIFGALSKLNINKDSKIILINSGKGIF